MKFEVVYGPDSVSIWRPADTEVWAAAEGDDAPTQIGGFAGLAAPWLDSASEATVRPRGPTGVTCLFRNRALTRARTALSCSGGGNVGARTVRPPAHMLLVGRTGPEGADPLNRVQTYLAG